ncbi:sensor histidine kinase [Qipengyuania marisflavi]|uniref:histidine kinase n=1 Tax=Qipengyuania marisflavi TaxID=2486356 RepID=A0A5S3PBH3_9SPHN|nr:PAS domain-containing protein [Qipengyuania marisflavi]TMM48398.1 PAS domain S-box protein [Qipengyuania marisflavi]
MYPKSRELWPQGVAPAQAFCAEDKRLTVLAAYGTDALIDDPELQRIVELIARICDAPVAMVTMVEANRQHFLAKFGVDERETPRPTSFCAHAMLGDEPMVINDATVDPRFADNELVTGDPFLRFYAGQPLISDEGAPLGALCVIDMVPRPMGLTPLQRETLAVLAEAVMRRLSQGRQGRAATNAIKRRENRLKTMIDSVPGIAWSADADGNLDYVNARWSEITGAPVPQSVKEWADHIHPDDREASLTRWTGSMRNGEAHEDEIRMLHADGSHRWVLSRAIPVLEEGSGGNRWFGTVIDIDKAYRLSESRDLLANELSHRIKNIFAVVSGLIAVRSRGKPEVKDFVGELSTAIRALGIAHDYVRPFDGRKTDKLQGLLRDLLAPYDNNGKRFDITGGDVAISPRTATPLALIFHELATNSAKYGALSSHDGRVTVEITLPKDGDDGISVAWRESSDVTIVPVIKADEGFGSRLLRLAIEGQLGGRFTREFSDDGLDVLLEFPMDRIAG